MTITLLHRSSDDTYTVITSKSFINKKSCESKLRHLQNRISFEGKKAEVAFVTIEDFKFVTGQILTDSEKSLLEGKTIAAIDADEVNYSEDKKEFYSKI